MKPILFIGADHRGYNLKQSLIQNLDGQLNIIDCGTHREQSTDYSDYAQTVAQEVRKNPASFGVLICGTDSME
jgi:ribose 5-phosphate isomerase B